LKRILILTTGGTIVSLKTVDGLKPHNEEMKTVLYNKILPLMGDYDVTIKPIFNKDSSNIIPSDWIIAWDFISSHIDDYDGIVILHGTDTMSYSAAMISFMFIGVKKPIVLTGSQVPIDFDGSDGVNNLKDAIIAAGDSRLSGVYVVFHDKIIKGTRAYKSSSINHDAYISCNYPYVGVIKDGRVFITEEYKKMEQLETKTIRSNYQINKESYQIPKVFMLKMVPGIDGEIFDYIKEKNYQGVVIEGYGLGGMPVLDTLLLDKMESLILSGIPVLMSTQCIYDGVNLDTYEVGVTANRIGIVSTYDMTPDAAYTKLMWILGFTRNYDEVIKALKTNFCGEIVIIEDILEN
jgi:L-asparaginase